MRRDKFAIPPTRNIIPPPPANTQTTKILSTKIQTNTILIKNQNTLSHKTLHIHKTNPPHPSNYIPTPIRPFNKYWCSCYLYTYNLIHVSTLSKRLNMFVFTLILFNLYIPHRFVNNKNTPNQVCKSWDVQVQLYMEHDTHTHTLPTSKDVLQPSTPHHTHSICLSITKCQHWPNIPVDEARSGRVPNQQQLLSKNTCPGAYMKPKWKDHKNYVNYVMYIEFDINSIWI